MAKFESTIEDLRGAVDDAEGLTPESRRAIDIEIENIEAMYNRMEEERDAALDASEGIESEELVETKVRDGLARELEAIFGAIYAGDIEGARGGVSELYGTLRGDDPIIVAIQRARSRPRLHQHIAA